MALPGDLWRGFCVSAAVAAIAPFFNSEVWVPALEGGWDAEPEVDADGNMVPIKLELVEGWDLLVYWLSNPAQWVEYLRAGSVIFIMVFAATVLTTLANYRRPEPPSKGDSSTWT